MIRYYAYYSCGGYKDMYLGKNQDFEEYSYFLPLLPKWKSMEKAKPEYASKLENINGLQLIEIVSNQQTFSFPEKAKQLFSHGGFKMIYRALDNGETCLCVKNIPSNAKDEESRDIPFSLLMTASGNDVKQLDAFAIYYVSHIDELDTLFAGLFTYDAFVNGIRFNLRKINEQVKGIPALQSEILHRENQIYILLLDAFSMYQKACKELNIASNQIDWIVDTNGESKGGIRYRVVSHSGCDSDESAYREEEEGHVGVEVVSIALQNPSATEKTLPETVGKIEQQVSETDEKKSGLKDSSAVSDILDDLKATLNSIQRMAESNALSVQKIQQLLSGIQLEHRLTTIQQTIESCQKKNTEETNLPSAITSNEHDYYTIQIPKSQVGIIGIIALVSFLLGAFFF